MVATQRITALIILGALVLTLNQNCGGFRPTTFTGNSIFSGDSTVPLSYSDIAADPTEDGPYDSIAGEYKLPASLDESVTSDMETEIWARTFVPKTPPSGKLPLLVFLHGNHSTCGRPQGNIRVDDNCAYTDSGTCPAGYVVTPNHLGYDYLGKHFASHGYIVVSINANRGITCRNGGSGGDSGQILPRGRMTLRHLQQLSQWHKNGQTPSSVNFDFRAKIDFSRVGLMGHSRGGEGVRAALELYRDSNSEWPSKILEPVKFSGVFEIAPVDGMAGRELNGDKVPWGVLIPHCDGDVTDLSGIRPFDRVIAKFSTSQNTQSDFRFMGAVWGANHNFYNTEWQSSDSNGCSGHTPLWSPADSGSEKQRLSAIAAMSAFFRGNQEPANRPHYLLNLDSAFRMTAALESQFKMDRETFYGPTGLDFRVLEDFSQNFPMGSLGGTHQGESLTFQYGTYPPHDSDRKIARAAWQGGSGTATFRLNLVDSNLGVDLRSYKSLDLSLARAGAGSSIDRDAISLRLVYANGVASDLVPISQYAELSTPIGLAGNPKAVLQTVRVPFREIKNFRDTGLRSVELQFARGAGGTLEVSAIRLNKNPVPTFRIASPRVTQAFVTQNSTIQNKPSRKGTVRALPPVTGSGAEVQISSDSSEIEVESPEGFPVMNSLPTLKIGNQTFKGSRYPSSGNTDR
ncbi:MAG: hypothetical protein K2X47_02065, partial [Bdellovibrionales bacterium]|nr:hypothetical protein [Bdellovibrionales bacterium]